MNLPKIRIGFTNLAAVKMETNKKWVYWLLLQTEKLSQKLICAYEKCDHYRIMKNWFGVQCRALESFWSVTMDTVELFHSFYYISSPHRTTVFLKGSCLKIYEILKKCCIIFLDLNSGINFRLFPWIQMLNY